MGIIFSPWNSFAKFTQIIASLNFFGFEVSLVVFPSPQLSLIRFIHWQMGFAKQ
jgi:hypothetical protein